MTTECPHCGSRRVLKVGLSSRCNLTVYGEKPSSPFVPRSVDRDATLLVCGSCGVLFLDSFLISPTLGEGEEGND